MRLSSVKVLAFFLVVFVVAVAVLPLNEVSAASYEDIGWLYFLDDPQKRHLAELQIEYTFPDKVKAGGEFKVQLSLVYLKNDRAYSPWLEISDVSFHTRASPKGADSTNSEVDSSRVRLTPGEEYSRTFAISAPEKLGEYFVPLTYKMSWPDFDVYSYHLYGGEAVYDAGQYDDLIQNTRLIVEKAETLLTIRLENVKAAEIKIDGKTYTTDGGEVKVTFPPDGSHMVELPKEIELAPGTQAVFEKWSDGDTSNPRQLTLANDAELTAIYKIRYLLVVNSEIGSPQGGDWYDAGEKAAFSVTSPVTESGIMGILGAKTVFDHWSGDSTASAPAATITMDGPKTVTAIWKTDYTQAYIALGAIAAVLILAIVSVAVLMRRRTPIPPPPQAPVAPPAIKYCVQCGSQMPLDAIHCPRCGARQ